MLMGITYPSVVLRFILLRDNSKLTGGGAKRALREPAYNRRAPYFPIYKRKGTINASYRYYTFDLLGTSGRLVQPQRPKEVDT